MFIKGEIIKIKRLHKFIKNKDLNLRDWMIVSMAVNVGICLIIMDLLSLFYGELSANIAFWLLDVFQSSHQNKSVPLACCWYYSVLLCPKFSAILRTKFH
ncbi:hypothetical protein G8J22_02763 [Lentilactobacillus hilgardii]|uniref:Uncharacterized protein n=1 Tax=Lentilactobacillus hilgardii (strain ATCC 8290 / DSM 20176 / CCUG 30140 / JCM 1155 / KCTC 3500 / NBRC 15886 / NCIMB 8040 / NRRL B-1843 / 9) TaxID=1423757 RepID=C0XIG4_LENH9|nr:hypothetical protein HMPREF0497_0252 [Lentilactobacillus buchneri ATCC 11577]EEI24819.1 hypothetical protein HMPREF0519_1025 [Lentilactobacillus hilgardii DSM 20176 = ATCC 8290]MCT3395215.1 hypothetical protein [Lentilactobacillus hilgardii]KRK54584.1 hypothetical protein FD42_GL001094 [Lentilactobacillus hilgardii DSM 20176 = ATCC 8290]QEU39694.1 hypothetical protein LH500_12915 [Lentilactobacillus hilgardii]